MAFGIICNMAGLQDVFYKDAFAILYFFFLNYTYRALQQSDSFQDASLKSFQDLVLFECFNYR